MTLHLPLPSSHKLLRSTDLGYRDEYIAFAKTYCLPRSSYPKNYKSIATTQIQQHPMQFC